MSIWFFLWLILSGALLYFLGWTVFILTRQKGAWRAYASRHKLRYKPNSFFEAPEISGTIGNHTISVFSGEHMADDARRARKLMAAEVQLSGVMPIEGGVASGGHVDIVQSLGFKEEIRPKHPGWDKSWIASSSNKHVLESYLTPERLDALTSLMKIKSAWVILIFRDDVMLLRLDTPDPLDSGQKLDRLMKKMLQVADTLELQKGEDSRLKEEAAKTPTQAVSLEVSEDDLAGSAFQLEEDEDQDSEEDDEKPSTEKS